MIFDGVNPRNTDRKWREIEFRFWNARAALDGAGHAHTGQQRLLYSA